MREKVKFESVDGVCITPCPFGFDYLVGSITCATCVNYGSSNPEKKIVYCKIKRRTK